MLVRYRVRQNGTWSDDPWTRKNTKRLGPNVVAARGVVTSRIINNRREDVVDPRKLGPDHVRQYVFVDAVTDSHIYHEVYNKSRPETYKVLDVELVYEQVARERHLKLEGLREFYENQRRQQAAQWEWERQRRQRSNTSNANSTRKAQEAALRRLGQATLPGQSIVDRLKRTPAFPYLRP